MRIPLWNRAGDVVAHALVDSEDSHWSDFRWSLGSRGEAQTKIPGTREVVRLHRVILSLCDGDGLEGDHINGNRLDDRRINLRITTHAQNAQNRAANGKTSKYRGVSLFTRTGAWKAQANHGGKRYYLGLYEDEYQAALAVHAFLLEMKPFYNPSRNGF